MHIKRLTEKTKKTITKCKHLISPTKIKPLFHATTVPSCMRVRDVPFIVEIWARGGGPVWQFVSRGHARVRDAAATLVLVAAAQVCPRACG